MNTYTLNRVKRSLSLLVTFLIGAVLSSVVAFAWTGPTQTAPNGNVSAPINVGTTAQTKNAGLGVNALSVFGNTILFGASRYLNFGSLPPPPNDIPANGYGIRDNSGTMEVKNSGGNWSSVVAASTTLLQIKLADGSAIACSASAEGAQRYNATTKKMEYCNGTAWTSFGSSGVTSCRVCSQFQYEWYGYKWSGQGCSAYSSGNTLQNAYSGGGYGYVVQVLTSIQCQ